MLKIVFIFLCEWSDGYFVSFSFSSVQEREFEVSDFFLSVVCFLIVSNPFVQMWRTKFLTFSAYSEKTDFIPSKPYLFESCTILFQVQTWKDV